MKIHYHSDVHYFAGCERPLALLLSSDDLRHDFSISFSFGDYVEYRRDVRKYVKPGINEVPLRWKLVRETERVATEHGQGSFSPLSVSWVRSGVRLLRQHLHFVEALVRMTFLLWRIRPQILHLNNGGYPGATSVRAAALAGRLVGVKTIILVVNNKCLPYTSLERKSQFLQDQLVKRSVTHFVTASTEASLALQECLGIEPTKMLLIPNAVAHISIHPRTRYIQAAQSGQQQSWTIGCIAMYESRKGHSVLLEALAALRREAKLPTDLSVYFIGEGSERSHIENKVREFDLTREVHLLGYRHDYLTLLAEMDLLVVPSVDLEDSPLISLEAMQIGVPVIASNFGGLREQFDQQRSGLTFEPGNSAALAACLQRIFEEPGLRESLSENGPKIFQDRFSSDQFVSRYKSLYRRPPLD